MTAPRQYSALYLCRQIDFSGLEALPTPGQAHAHVRPKYEASVAAERRRLPPAVGRRMNVPLLPSTVLAAVHGLVVIA
ncbi:MAG: hypothetical protein KBH45_13450, partial [Verrucomicrobia bacterium]|nr:hypothetical protein [Verrucomicrobiota bacterium]